MKTVVLLLLLLFPSAALAGNVVFHLVTGHIPVANSEELKTFTPGIAFTTKAYRVGYLRNSFDKNSFYGAKLFPATKNLRFGAGLISGYEFVGMRLTGKNGVIIPLLAAEYDVKKNVSVLWMGRAFNLELKF